MRIKTMELPAQALEPREERCHYPLGKRAISVLLNSGRSSSSIRWAA